VVTLQGKKSVTGGGDITLDGEKMMYNDRMFTCPSSIRAPFAPNKKKGPRVRKAWRGGEGVKSQTLTSMGVDISAERLVELKKAVHGT